MMEGMDATSIAAELLVAAALALSVARAFFGRPPRRADAVAAAGWMAAGVLLLAAVLLADPEVTPRPLLAALAVEAICVAGWWLRSRDDDGGTAPPSGPEDPPSIDWDAFDRERGGWRPPTPPRELV
jgi:hypothetical protein